MQTVNHKKIIICLCLILLNMGVVFSQLKFGIKGGVDVVNNQLSSNILDASNRLGFQIGAAVEAQIPIVGLGVELAALYGKQEFDKEVHDTEGIAYNFSDYNYVIVPLNLKYRFSLVGIVGAFISAGPYVEFKLSGGDIERASVSEQWESKSYGAGLNAGAGIELLKHFELGMYYRKSLTDNYSVDKGIENIVKNRPDSWTVGATYFF